MLQAGDPPSEPGPRPEPSEARLTLTSVACGILAFVSAALLGLVQLVLPPWVGILMLVPLALAVIAVRSALRLPRDRRGKRIALFVLPGLAAAIVVPWMLFLATICIRGSNPC